MYKINHTLNSQKIVHITTLTWKLLGAPSEHMGNNRLWFDCVSCGFQIYLTDHQKQRRVKPIM